MWDSTSNKISGERVHRVNHNGVKTGQYVRSEFSAYLAEVVKASEIRRTTSALS